MENNFSRIILAGEGGQGVQALGKLFVHSAFNSSLHVAYMPNYGVEQRGGVSLGYLQLGKGIIGFPKFSVADIIVVMCSRAIPRIEQYVGENTLVIYDSSTIMSEELKELVCEKLPIPATEITTKKLTPRAFNMVLGGALLSELKTLSFASIEKTLEEIFKEKYKKKPELRNLNIKALQAGEKLAKEAYVKA
jgi:2-oxoglutarate ferredoxin oxidoreductase subunit gamma